MVVIEGLDAMTKGFASQTWNRRIDVIIGTIAILSFIFSLGINWSRLSGLEERATESRQRIDVVERGLQSLTLDIAKNGGDMAILSMKIDGIKSDVAEIKGSIRSGK